jgi:hypothetical protein
MPSGRSDLFALDRQRQRGEQRSDHVGAEQFPLPGDDQPDQDHERQREDRDAVGQVDQVGLGGGKHPDDLRNRALQRDPFVSCDQRAGDHRREEHRRQR